MVLSELEKEWVKKCVDNKGQFVLSLTIDNKIKKAELEINGNREKLNRKKFEKLFNKSAFRGTGGMDITYFGKYPKNYKEFTIVPLKETVESAYN